MRSVLGPQPARSRSLLDLTLHKAKWNPPTWAASKVLSLVTMLGTRPAPSNLNLAGHHQFEGLTGWALKELGSQVGWNNSINHPECNPVCVNVFHEAPFWASRPNPEKKCAILQPNWLSLPNTAPGNRPTATCPPRNWPGKHHVLSNWVILGIVFIHYCCPLTQGMTFGNPSRLTKAPALHFPESWNANPSDLQSSFFLAVAQLLTQALKVMTLGISRDPRNVLRTRSPKLHPGTVVPILGDVEQVVSNARRSVLKLTVSSGHHSWTNRRSATTWLRLLWEQTHKCWLVYDILYTYCL